MRQDADASELRIGASRFKWVDIKLNVQVGYRTRSNVNHWSEKWPRTGLSQSCKFIRRSNAVLINQSTSARRYK